MVRPNLDWTRLWKLFRFVIPADVQRTVYDPEVDELVKDHERRLEYSGKWEQRWIHFALFVRSLLLVLRCARSCLHVS